jgi:hypothetical protein
MMSFSESHDASDVSVSEDEPFEQGITPLDKLKNLLLCTKKKDDNWYCARW